MKMRAFAYVLAGLILATPAQASFNQLQVCKAGVSASYAGLVGVEQLSVGSDASDDIITRHTDDEGILRVNKCRIDGAKIYIHNGKRWTYMEAISMTYVISSGRLTVTVNHPTLPTTMVWSDRGFTLIDGP